MNASLQTLNRRRLLALLSSPLLATAAAFAATPGGLVVGSGKVATQKRSVPHFEAVTLNGGMRLVLRQSARESLELRADDNLLDLIETRVVMRGGVPTLEIGVREGASYRTRSEMLVTAELPTLRALTIAASGDSLVEPLKTAALALTVSGSGSVTLQSLSAGQVTMALSGSGSVTAAGSADGLSIDLSGSGDADTGALRTEQAKVASAGSGSATVRASKTLTVSITASGDVTQLGQAAPKAAVTGSGTLNRR